jgi:putative transposase
MKNKKKDPQQFTLPDSLWQKIQPLLPQYHRKGPGRPPIDDRKAMTAICYILHTGCQWKALPRYLGAKSTIHDRLQLWANLGVFQKMWTLGLHCYDQTFQLQWQWQSLDGCHILAPKGGDSTGASYKHRGKTGSNRSLLTDQDGIPLAVFVAPANRNDFLLTELTFQSFAIQRPHPKALTQNLCLDKGYDYPEVDTLLRRWNYVGHIRRKGEPDLPLENKIHKPKRWVVERSHAWLNNFRALAIRWNRKLSNYMALLHFACAIITFRAAKIIPKIL